MTNQTETPPAVPPTQRKRRLWLRIVLIIAAGTIVLIVAAPWLLSTGPGERIILNIANAQLYGRLGADDISLRWFEPTQLRGVRLDDAQGRRVVDIQSVRWDGGVWRLLTSPMNLGAIAADEPKISLLPDPAGGFSLQHVAKPSPSQEPSAFNNVHAQVIANRGQLLVQTDQGQTMAENLFLDLSADTLNHVRSQLTTRLAGGTLQLKQDLTNLLQNGQLDISQARGTVNVQTTAPVQIAELRSVIGRPNWRMAGTAALRADLTLQPEGPTGTVHAELVNAQFARPHDPQPANLDLVLDATGNLTPTAIVGTLAIQGHPGSASNPGAIRANLNIDRASLRAMLDAPEPLSFAALLSGSEGVTLAKGTLTASGKLDLAILARAVPALLTIREGVVIQEGTYDFDLTADSTAEPYARSQFTLSPIKAVNGDRPLAFDAVTGTFLARLPAGKPLDLAGSVTSDFIRAQARGQLDSLEGDLSVDLALLRDRVEELTTWAALVKSGKLTSHIAIRRLEGNVLAGSFQGRGDDIVPPPNAQGQSTVFKTVGFDIQGSIQTNDKNVVQLAVLDKLALQADNLNIDAKGRYDFRTGSSEGFEATLAGSDLAALRSRLEGLDLWPQDLGMAGQATVALAGSYVNKQLNLTTLTAQLTRFALAGPRLGQIDWPAATLSAPLLYDVRSRRLTLQGTGAQFSSPWGSATAPQMAVALQPLGLEGRATLARVDLAQVTKSLAPLLQLGTGYYAGVLNADMAFTQPAGGTGILSNGTLQVTGFATDREVLSPRPVVVAWKDLRADTVARVIATAQTSLESDVANVRIVNGQLSYGPGPRTMSAGIDLTADLARVRQVAGPLMRKDQDLVALAGILKWNGQAGTSANTVTIPGQGTIDNLVIGAGQDAVQQKQVNFKHTVVLDTATHTAQIQQFSTDSELLSIALQGFIRRYDQDQLLDLRGQYRGDWAQMTRLIHQLAPATTDNLAWSGQLKQEFVVTGPAAQPTITPTYRGVSANTGVNWASADIYGMHLGPADLPVRMANGQIVVPTEAVDANNGKLNLGGVILLPNTSAGQPMYRLPGQLTVLDRVDINEQMSTELLSRLHPMFFKPGRISGKITLTLEDVEMPLGSTALAAGRIRHGRVSFENLEIQPTGLLKDLLGVVGTAGKQFEQGTGNLGKMEIPGVDFWMQDGRFYYDNFLIIWNNVYRLKFSGSVGLNGQVNLVVGLPITPELVGSLGKTRLMPEVVQKLTGAMQDQYIPVQIAGDRTVPQVNWAQAGDILKPILDKAGTGLLQGGGDVKKLFEGIPRLLPAPK